MKKEPLTSKEALAEMRAEEVFECPNLADKTFWECKLTLQAFIKYCRKPCRSTTKNLTSEQRRLMEKAKDVLQIMHHNEWKKIPYSHENPA